MYLSEKTYYSVYDKLENRLNQLGRITTKEACILCERAVGVSAQINVFHDIMDKMIVLKKAKKMTTGAYYIFKPNTPTWKK